MHLRRGEVPFSPLGVLRDFRNVFRNRIFLLGAATLSLSYIRCENRAVRPGG
jgi:hypothetical protein